MPRDSNGDYTLPAGNPVVTLTTISSTWANTTLEDIGEALTDSLDRAGAGGMTGQLKLANGLVGAPGLSWTTEPNSGLYRNGAGDFRYSISANDIFVIQATGVTAIGVSRAQGTEPRIIMNETDAPADEKIYDFVVSAGNFAFRTRTDVDGAGADILTLVRNGTALTSMTYNAGSHVFNGGNVVANADNTRSLGVNGTRWSRIYVTDVRSADTEIMLDSTGTILRLGGTGQAWTEIRSGEHFVPDSNNTLDLGSASLRWNQVFATELIDGADSLIRSSGTTVSIAASATWTAVNFPNGVLQYNSREVGYRGSNTNTQGGATYSIVQDDNGRVVYMTNGGATTVTVDQLTAGSMVTVANNSAASNCTLTAGSGVTLILSGVGTTGNRTVGIRGVASLWWATATAVFVTGAGVT